MTVSYEVYLTDQFGTRFALLDTFENLRYGIGVNDVGTFSMTFLAQNFPRSYFEVDNRVEIVRRIDRAATLITVGFLRELNRRTENDLRVVEIAGPNAMDLLARRIVDADETSALAEKDGAADDVMKEYVDEALGGSAAAGRDITDYNFSIQSDLSQGPTVYKAAARAPLLQTLQEISRDSIYRGTPIFFDVVHPTPDRFEFQTFLNQRGQDRSQGAGNEVTLSEETGTLTNAALTQSWRDEVTYVYAGGDGQGLSRTVHEEEDTTRSALSVFNRREAFADGRNYTDANALESFAKAVLYDGRPVQRFSGEIADVPNNRFGVDWGVGDKLTAVYDEEVLDVWVQSVSVEVTDAGKETITGRLSLAT